MRDDATTAPQPAHLPQETQQERLRFAQALRSVFGQENARNDDQARVWAWLEETCFVRTTTLALTNDMQADALRMAHHEGARRVLLAINHELRWLAQSPEKRPKVGQKTP